MVTAAQQCEYARQYCPVYFGIIKMVILYVFCHSLNKKPLGASIFLSEKHTISWGHCEDQNTACCVMNTQDT